MVFDLAGNSALITASSSDLGKASAKTIVFEGTNVVVNGLESWSSGIPTGQIGQPEEFGNVVAFFRSPKSSYINGVVIPDDGGRMSSNL